MGIAAARQGAVPEVEQHRCRAIRAGPLYPDPPRLLRCPSGEL